MNHHKKLAKVVSLIVIIILLTTGYLYFKKGFSFEDLKQVIVEQGARGYVIYIVYLMVSTILIPLASLPLWPIVLYSYGFWPSIILTFIGNLFGGMANFLIARIFGRNLVQKIAGKKFLKEVDSYSKDIDNWKSLFLVRTLGNISFDVVSYAVGLTKINIVHYFIATVVTTFAWVFGAFFLLDKAIAFGRIPSMAIIGVVYFLALYGSYELWHRHHSHK